MAEYGVVAPTQIAQLRKAIPRWLEDAENGLTHRFRRLLSGLREDVLTLDQRIKDLDQEVAEVAKTDPTARRLMKPQGAGPLIATAFVSSLGDGQPFRKRRDYAVFLGLTPRQHSSGGKDRILGINKRGDSHLESGTKRVDQGDPLLYQLQ